MDSAVESPQLVLEKKLAEIHDKKLVVVEEHLLLQNLKIPGEYVKLNKEPPNVSSVSVVIYIVRPNVDLMDTIATHVQLCSKKTVSFQLWLIPAYSALCEKRLEQRSVRGAFSHIVDLPWSNNIPVDVVLSPHLKSERTNLQLLQESACLELMDQLKAIQGKKVLIIDQSLLGVIDLITHNSVFKSHNIQLKKFHEDMKGELNVANDITNVIYLVRPHVQLMETISVQIRQISKQKNRNIYLFFVPRRSCLCENYLKENDMLSNFKQISEVCWNFVPLDVDVVSMELPDAYRDINVHKDPTVLYQAALGLMELQRLYGRIPKIRGKGENSQCIWDAVQQLSAEEKSLVNGELGAIDQLIMLDRSIDHISVLATQLTYEGLLDENYNIKQNKVTLTKSAFTDSPTDVAAAASPSTSLTAGDKVVELHSGDKFYADIRNKSFQEVRMILQREVRELANMKQNSTMSKDSNKLNLDDIEKSLDAAKAFTKKKSILSLHTDIASMLNNEINSYEFGDNIATEHEFILCEGIDKPSIYIENLIAKKSDLRNVLRLVCLQCAAASGLKEKVLNYYKRELVHVYGIKVLLTISNLEKAGLLHSQSESRSYEVLRRTLNLTDEHANEVEPKDITFVHNIYAPLTVRIVENALKQAGWTAIKSTISNLPGPSFEDNQIQLKGITGRSFSNVYALNSRVVLVFFVGGCTFAEIAALRFLAQQEDKNVEFLIATTKIINKNTFLDALIDNAS